MHTVKFVRTLSVTGGALFALLAAGCGSSGSSNLSNSGAGGIDGGFGAGGTGTGGFFVVGTGGAGGGGTIGTGGGGTIGSGGSGGTSSGGADAGRDAQASAGGNAGSPADAAIPDSGSGASSGTDAGNVDAGNGTDSGVGTDAGKKCGNGVVDTGEDCDTAIAGTTGCTTSCHWFCVPGASGNATCDDHLICDGTETCGNDHLCAPGTNAANGTTCESGGACQSGLCASATCGDGITQSPEECDDGNAVNGDGCDTNCKFSCVSTDSTRNCSALQTPCETPITCNDGTHVCSTPTQKPDDTLCGAHNYCKAGVCTAAACGNGKVEPTEQCDDGNQTNGDGCDNDCAYSCVTPATDCGAAPACEKETCTLAHTCSAVADQTKDDAACGTGRVCSAGNCINSCGNGIVDAADGEQCDDGNTVNGDGCNNNCLYSCSNPTTDCTGTPAPCDKWACGAASHACQSVPDSTKNDTTCGSALVCNASGSCVNACGNGIVDTGEACDDGNTVNGDGCNNNCQFSCSNPATDCSGSAGTCQKWSCNGTHQCAAVADTNQNGNTCGSGQVCASGVCGTSCGNGHVDPGEACDDGNTVNGDGCNNNCQFSCTVATTDCTPMPCQVPSCVANADGKVCNYSPDGTQNDKACGSGLVCSAGTCINSCGNGIVDAADGEACDDGNSVNGDGCNNNCQFTCANPVTDCAGAPTCQIAVCTAGHVCADAADPTQNDKACAAGKVCSSGACVNACGNGIVDSGEECDDGNSVNGDGCNNDCTFSCSDPATDCGTAPACEVESCTAGHVCLAVADATQNEASCGTGKVCNNGSCVTACGDGIIESGEQCEPPNTATCDANCQNQCDVDGSWASLLTIPVTWVADGVYLSKGSGNIKVWSLVTTSQSGTANTVLPCGITVPNFSSALGTYYITFPNSLFDNDYLSAVSMPATFSSLKAGATYSTNAAFTSLIGMSAPATGAWPAAASGVTEVDQDADNQPGVTAATDAPTAVFGTAADHIDLAIRQTTALSGTLTDCTHLSGSATVSAENNHVLGCTTATGAKGADVACNATQYGFLDSHRPIYVVGAGATFVAQKMANAATCANVRADYP